MTETRRGNAGGLYVKELTVPKTPMKEDMWMPFTKTKTRKASNVFDIRNNNEKILMISLKILEY